MIPHALHEVKFDYRSEENWKETSLAFATIFAEKGSKKSKTYHAQAVNYHLKEATRQLVPNKYGASSFRCSRCNDQFCRRSSCLMSMQECRYCAFSFCRDCDYCQQCGDCGHNYCTDCETPIYCNDCNKFSCDACNNWMAANAVVSGFVVTVR